MEIKAISLDPKATDSNLKKKVNMAKTANPTAIKPQFTRAFNEGNKAEEMAKPMPKVSNSARQI